MCLIYHINFFIYRITEESEELWLWWSCEERRANHGVDCRFLCIRLIFKERFAVIAAIVAMIQLSSWTESVI